jgi:hypothetical protein
MKLFVNEIVEKKVVEVKAFEHVDAPHQNAHLSMKVNEVIWVETLAGTVRISTIPAHGALVEVYGGSAKTIKFKRI